MMDMQDGIYNMVKGAIKGASLKVREPGRL